MSQIRVMIAVAGLVVALAPVGAQAQALTNEDVIAANRAAAVAAIQQANLANDLARCLLASAGTLVPGTVSFSQPNPGGCMATPVGTTGVNTGSGSSNTCVTATRSLTKAERDQVNAFEISVNKATASNLPPPMPSPDILALTC